MKELVLEFLNLLLFWDTGIRMNLSRAIQAYDLLATEVEILFLELRTALDFNFKQIKLRSTMEAGNFDSYESSLQAFFQIST